MQAGQPKSDRKASAGARASARPSQRQLRRASARLTRIIKSTVEQKVQEGRKAWASPSHIAEIAAAHILTCANHRAVMAELKAERSKATTPAEAASNESAN